jgi:hypothetical protein
LPVFLLCALSGFCTSPVETGPADLCFDLEAASRYREQEESPTSVSNCDDPDDVGLFEDTLADSPAVTSYSTRNLPLPDSVVQSGSLYNGMDTTQHREMRRRLTSFAKHKRMSLIATVKPAVSIVPTRKSLFTRPLKGSFVPSEIFLSETLTAAPIFPSSQHSDWEAQFVHQQMCPVQAAFMAAGILGNVLSYLHEHELLRIASLVCSSWSDTATHAHANLMLMSVGCTGSNPEVDDESEAEESAALSTHGVPGLLERPWTYLTNSFPWGCFLSEGAFKQVYKVYNRNLGVEEAVSVM